MCRVTANDVSDYIREWGLKTGCAHVLNREIYLEVMGHSHLFCMTLKLCLLI
jgi:hypothetical protein